MHKSNEFYILFSSRNRAVFLNSKTWENCQVPYELEEGYSKEFYKEFIKKAMILIYKHTGIKFIKRTKEKDFAFIKDKCGCQAVVGKVGNKQNICIG